MAPIFANGEFKQGFYTGLKAGWSQFDASQTAEEQNRTPVYTPVPSADKAEGRKFKKNVLSPDVFFGYRYRKAHQPWTVAVEMSLLFGKLRPEINTQETGHENYVISILERNIGGAIHLKPGYLWGEKCMLFGIIGVCLDRYKWEYTEHIYGRDFRRNDKKLLPGIVLGLGAERAIERVHVGVQATYTLYNRKTFEGGLSRPYYNVRMKVNPRILHVALYLSYVF